MDPLFPSADFGKNTRQSSVWSLDEALQMGSLQFIQFIYRVLEANHDLGYRSVVG
jgi:hypothetical protein